MLYVIAGILAIGLLGIFINLEIIANTLARIEKDLKDK
jgi:hypothetical protein